jgi:hypothetical protein
MLQHSTRAVMLRISGRQVVSRPRIGTNVPRAVGQLGSLASRGGAVPLYRGVSRPRIRAESVLCDFVYQSAITKQRCEQALTSESGRGGFASGAEYEGKEQAATHWLSTWLNVLIKDGYMNGVPPQSSVCSATKCCQIFDLKSK